MGTLGVLRRHPRPPKGEPGKDEDDGEGEMSIVVSRKQARAKGENFRAIEPDDRQNRSELDHHGEDAARVVVPDPSAQKQQMGGGRNRQKLGDSLDEAKQRSS